MAIGFENYKVKSAYDPDSRYTDKNAPTHVENDDMKSETAQRIFTMLREWWDQARKIESDNRRQQDIDADYYDGLQWAEEEILELQERGQAPYVFNIVKPAIDWIIGTQQRTRMNNRVLARKGSEEARKDAELKTKVLKYVDDVNHGAKKLSAAFASAAKVGVGWLEDGVSNDETKSIIYSDIEDWRNIWRDPLSTKLDMSDARFLFRAKWIDIDIAIQMMPEKKSELCEAADTQTMIGGDEETDYFWGTSLYQMADDKIIRTGWADEMGAVDNRRPRVRLIEAWYRMPVKAKKMRSFDVDLNGEIFDEKDEKHLKALEEEVVSLQDAIVMKMYYAIFAGNHLLKNNESPYRHNDFPFTPIWAYRRSKDNAPYGPIRQIRDPQTDFNKRASKSLFILSTNQVMAEEDAVDADMWDEVIDQSTRPDGVMKLRKGGLGKIQINRDVQLANEHLMLMDRDQAMVRNTSGVQGESLGATTNAVSGKAILAKQDEGSVVTFELYDNLRFAMTLRGKKRLSLIEQYMDTPAVVRITGESGRDEYIDINELRFDPASGEWFFENDMTKFSADYVVDQEDFRATIRQSMVDQMFEMVSRMPGEISLQLLDMIIEASDLPNREEFVKRIREINGQRGPDDEETPEQAQARMEQEQAQARAQQLAEQKTVADIQETQASAADKQASAAKKQAEIAQTNVETQGAAVEAGEKVVMTPAAAMPADEILASAGFVDQNARQG